MGIFVKDLPKKNPGAILEGIPIIGIPEAISSRTSSEAIAEGAPIRISE